MIIQLREGSFEALSPDVYVLVVKQPRLTDHWTWAGALLSKAGIGGGFLIPEYPSAWKAVTVGIGENEIGKKVVPLFHFTAHKSIKR